MSNIEKAPKGLVFRKSSFSEGEGDCVEVATTVDSAWVRHSKNPGGAVLRYTSGEWTAFIAGVMAGEFLLR